MDRWQDFGTLGKAATISAWGAAVGVGLAVVIGKMSDSRDATFAALVLWFAPAILWALCSLAVAAKSNWPVTAGLATGALVVGGMMNPAMHDVLLWVVIGTPLLCAAMAVFADPARALLDIGRAKK